jgi:hypothetical protein
MMPGLYLCLKDSHQAIASMPYEFDLSSDESASKRAHYLTKARIQTASSSTNLEGMHPSERILIKQYQLLKYKVSNIWKCILVSNILLPQCKNGWNCP